MLIFLLIQMPSFAERAVSGSISGRFVIKQGETVQDGMVFFYSVNNGPPPAPQKYWSLPEHESSFASDGKFYTKIPEGRYYILAIIRASGETGTEPPAKGDYLFIGSNKKGTPKTYRIQSGKHLDIGVISDPKPFKGMQRDKVTAIKGTVYDRSGDTVKDVMVFAGPSSDSLVHPVYLSQRTGPNGKYILYLEGGNYFLGVFYAGELPDNGISRNEYIEEKMVSVDTEEIKRGVDIRVKNW